MDANSSQHFSDQTEFKSHERDEGGMADTVHDDDDRSVTKMGSKANEDHTDYRRKERVTSWEMINPGDHIAWRQTVGYYHDAILTSVDPSQHKLTIIEYGWIDVHGKEKSYTCVKETVKSIKKFNKEPLYLFIYDPAICYYTPKEVIERARKRLGEREYNMLTNNSGHFATWCKCDSKNVPSRKTHSKLHRAAISPASIEQLNDSDSIDDMALKEQKYCYNKDSNATDDLNDEGGILKQDCQDENSGNSLCPLAKAKDQTVSVSDILNEGNSQSLSRLVKTDQQLKETAEGEDKGFRFDDDDGSLLEKDSEATEVYSGYKRKERVTSWEMISRGDHIAWQRVLCYWHHAILISIGHEEVKNETELTYIEYGKSKEATTSSVMAEKRLFFCVQENKKTIKKFDEVGLFFYRYQYDAAVCYKPDEVIERARSRLGERKYNILTNNCEHLATWCKIIPDSSSRPSLILRQIDTSAASITTSLDSGTVNADPLNDIQDLKETVENKDEAKRGGRCGQFAPFFRRVGVWAAATSLTASDLKLLAATEGIALAGGLGFVLVLNVAIELCLFGWNYYKLKKRLNAGQINATEFRKRKFEMIGESVAGLLTSIVCSLCSLLVPWPGLIVAPIVCMFCVPAARVFGSWVGRMLHDYTIKWIAVRVIKTASMFFDKIFRMLFNRAE